MVTTILPGMGGGEGGGEIAFNASLTVINLIYNFVARKFLGP